MIFNMKAIIVPESLSKKEIDDRIREIIRKIYQCEYVRNIRIDRLHPIGYKISLPLNSHERPYTLAIEADGDNFFTLFEEMLREASLNSVEFYDIVLHDGHPEYVYQNNIKGDTDPNYYSRVNDKVYLSGDIYNNTLKINKNET